MDGPTRRTAKRVRAYELMGLACRIWEYTPWLGDFLYKRALRSYYRHGGGAIVDDREREKTAPHHRSDEGPSMRSSSLR